MMPLRLRCPAPSFAAFAVSAFALTACQTVEQGPRPGSGPTTLDEVVALNDRICGTTRPSFAGAKARMVENGLTIEKDGRNFSPTKNVSASVETSDRGRVVCSVRSTFQGNWDKLNATLDQRFGRMKTADQISPFIRVYNRGSKGKLLVLIQPNRGPNAQTVVYDVGYAQGI